MYTLTGFELSGIKVTSQHIKYTLTGLHVVRSKGYYTVQCIHLQVYKLSEAKVTTQYDV